MTKTALAALLNFAVVTVAPEAHAEDDKAARAVIATPFAYAYAVGTVASLVALGINLVEPDVYSIALGYGAGVATVATGALTGFLLRTDLGWYLALPGAAVGVLTFVSSLVLDIADVDGGASLETRTAVSVAPWIPTEQAPAYGASIALTF